MSKTTTGILISAIVGVIVVVIPVTIGVCTGSIHFKRLLESPVVHQHQWGLWGEPKTVDSSWIQFRSCTNCGLSEMRHVAWGK
jgi:hypothetical protein